ncbi:MAG: ABC transporter permease [Bacteroidetes bacterium]|nr:ABC transporter permease [Bacteroidota bacterium]
MIKNYLTSVWRYISKNKAFTGINLLGLVIGMTAFMLIVQYALHELSYDNFWANTDRVYRVKLDRYDKGELSTRWASGCAGIGPDLKTNFPEVEHYVRLTKSNALLSNGDTFFKEESVYYASQDFFNVFGMHLVSGVDSTALKGLHKIVLSKTMAKKYFGNENPIGKTMHNNGRTEYQVTGVFEDLPENSHMAIDAMLSFATYAKLVGKKNEAELNEWQWDGFLTYVLLRENTGAKALERKLPAYVQKREGEELKRFNSGMTFHLMKLKDIHLDSDFIGEFKPNGSRDTTYFILVIAVLIIVIAWINYVNLSTAKSIERAREVGVRKVMGGFRWQLVQQFLVESFILNATAVILAIVAVILLTPWFNELTGREIDHLLLRQKLFWVWAALLIAGGTLLSGLYPAFVLSAFKPVEVLKGRFKNTGQGVFFRKGMVVLQFMSSVILIVGTYTVYNQINYMRSQKLGINIEQTVVLRSPNITDSTYGNKFEVLKNRLTQYSEVTSVSGSSSIPGASPDWNAGGIRRLSQREDEQKQYRVIMMDHDFIPLYGLEVMAGRKFSADVSNEDKTVLLNESGARHMGFSKIEDALGDQINFWGDTFRIVGVVKNFRQESLKKDFEPLIFRYNKAPFGFYSIKFNTSNVKESLAKFENDWKQFFPGNPFNYFFLDEHYNKQYQADQQFGKVFGLFSGLAIFIACLGLFGLSSLTAIQRTKEIGVRKVLGASIGSILTLVSKEYLLLMSASIALAIPLTWWIITNWLQGFANRIPLTWWLFTLPSLVVMMIAFLTVSIHILRVARTNPVNSLRYE